MIVEQSRKVVMVLNFLCVLMIAVIPDVVTSVIFLCFCAESL